MAIRFMEYRGVKSLYAAKVTEVTRVVNGVEETVEEYGVPFQLSGVQEISNELSESSETHYYDNIGAIVVDSEGDDTYTLTVSVPSLRTRAIIEGTYYDEATGALVGTPKYRDYYAIGFIGNKLNGEDEYVWVLKGKFSGGGATHTTKDDGTDATNIQYTFTSIHTSEEFAQIPNEDGLPQTLKTYTVEAGGKVDVSKWFNQVVTPDNINEILFDELSEDIATPAPATPDWYLGKSGTELQSADTQILENGKVFGTLYHVTGFTEFNATVPEEQEGYYFGFVLEKTGDTMTFKKNGVVTKQNIAWEANNIFRVQSSGDKFEVLVDGVSAVTFDFSNIIFG